MQPQAVHQFLIACQPGDGITNGAFFARRLLRARGLASEIYAVDIPPELAGDVRPLATYQPGEDQVLLIHHGYGNGYEDWLRSLPERKILIYHNITPEHFFPEDDPIRADLRLGREQLGTWRDWLDGAIGDSPQNTSELLDAGYPAERTHPIPLLVDLDRLRAQEPATGTVRAHEGRRTLLFVGRRVPHKGQLALIQALHRLQGLTDQPTELVLAGGGDPDYIDRLEREIAARGLADRVHMPGKVAEEDLAAYFAAADAYISLSEHEGFGMPLVEAMVYDVPVVAYAPPESSVDFTVGEGGLVLEESSPEAMAATLAVLFEEPGLRSGIVGSQRRRLAAFETGRIQEELGGFLAALGIDLPDPRESPDSPHPALRYRVEGPFDSSYSLALLNREVARGLNHRHPDEVGLFATEGGGDLTPDDAFLATNPEIRAMWERGRAWRPAEFVTRLLFPPRVTGMHGRFRVLNSYGWEESGFPRTYVRQFNAHLDLVTTMSGYVAKILRDNGVRTPMAKTGVGADHILRVAPDPAPLPELGGGMRILHISSAFPRKGVDVLLQAYARAFRASDDVVLVLKTFPNPHNTVEDQLAALKRDFPDHGRIVLINEDLGDAAIRALYEQCHVLAAPSRGEGYGLPVAEAMLHRMPVVTTAYGGQADFATDDTAWLIDYRFERADTHIGVWDSLWVEPSPEDLEAALRTFHERFQAGDLSAWARPRVDRAQALIQAEHTWEAVARRLEAAAQRLEAEPALTPQPRLGWVSTWNARCGLATYSEQLLARSELNPLILANRDAEPLAEDGDQVVRCWRTGSGDPLDALFETIRANDLEQVAFQFNFSLFGLEPLRRLLRRLHDHGIQTILFLHSTEDVTIGEEHKSLHHLLPELKESARVLVHSVADLNRLKAMGVVANAALFPHGVAEGEEPELGPDQAASGLRDKTVIASHGFLLPHKGIQALIEAFAELAANRPHLHLLLVNAEYPVAESARERHLCEKLIAQLGLEGRVSLITDFLPESEIRAWLSLADVVVYPYRHTQESASGAVRWGLSAQRPVLCSPLPIFEDVAEVVRFLPGTEPGDIAGGLAELVDDPVARRSQQGRQDEWLAAHHWAVLAERLEGCLAGLYRDG